MKTVVYITRHNKEHDTVLEAFAQGLSRIPVDYEVRLLTDYVPSDIAVVFGIGKKNVPVSFARGRVIAEQMKRDLPTIVLEKGYVKRDRYYAAGWNGLNGRADFNNAKMPSGRWDDLGVDLTPWRRGADAGKKVLIIGQVPSDASVQHIDIVAWCSKIALRLRGIVPNHEIVFRPHPLARSTTPRIMGTKWSTRPLEEDLKDAMYVVTFNSNTGVDAIIQGVPVFVGDAGSMCYDVASKKLGEAYVPEMSIVKQWAYNLAYAQWTVEEMGLGLPFLHLTSGIEGRMQA